MCLSKNHILFVSRGDEGVLLVSKSRDTSVEPALEFRAIKWIRVSVANYKTTLSSDSLDTGTGSSNSLSSASHIWTPPACKG